jgi:hypothetical protein
VKRKKKRLHQLTPAFVDEIPGTPEHGKLYLSCRYRAAVHLCACGCGAKISTPLHPTGWRLSYDGESVSLSPSVGNWSEKCQSHYVIKSSRVLWGDRLPREKIRRIREQRHRELEHYYGVGRRQDSPQPSRAEWFWAKVWDLVRPMRR